MKNFYRKFVSKILLPDSKVIYSQAGEDLIISNYLYKLGISQPTYLDIGANHPTYISNTYFFYIRGSKGVCVEPNPVLFRKFKLTRPRDIVLNVGIGHADNIKADFYLFPYSAHGLSTFSKEEAFYWQNIGMEGLGNIYFEKVIEVELQTINSVMKNFDGKSPDIVSIDVEGLDLEILRSLDYEHYHPLVFCVETLGYDDQKREFKRTEILEFLQQKGYSVYADTHINTIFIRNQY